MQFNNGFAETEEEKNTFNDFIVTDYYVNEWVAFPKLSGEDLEGNKVVQTPRFGYVDVVIFIASWCVPCQEIVERINNLETHFSKLNSRFTFVFSHDLYQDAKAFSEVYKIKHGVIATHDILKNFHNPELPSVYISDRHGWILTRFLNATPEELDKIEEVLTLLTSY